MSTAEQAYEEAKRHYQLAEACALQEEAEYHREMAKEKGKAIEDAVVGEVAKVGVRVAVTAAAAALGIPLIS
ncbi:MAG: hypothetical protein IKI11_01860 [Neisseriaceae bacterium]|nr:hypothetical protein [Neisseriaceae bacterium]